ncbi:molybdenum cofactor guanylyltransferase, partial [Xanthomonas perforans]|uniref:molybdenum cofactor guanylyltransferase n=1 Tax=Xanthomonas perforans TaxID=442694 RepID=UPI001F1BCB6C
MPRSSDWATCTRPRRPSRHEHAGGCRPSRGCRMTLQQPWTGVVLAGGRSSRMGQDKALLPW